VKRETETKKQTIEHKKQKVLVFFLNNVIMKV